MNAEDERKALVRLLNADHGHALMPGGNECRTCLRRVDSILTSDVWRNRVRGPITDREVQAFKEAWHEADGEGDSGNRVRRGLQAARDAEAGHA